MVAEMQEREVHQDLAVEIAPTLNEALGGAGNVGAITLLMPGVLADGTTKLLVKNAAGIPAAVVLCADHAAPGMVARAMTRAKRARDLLGPLGEVICTPLAEGETRGLSYTVLPYLQPLSDSRLKWRWQRYRLRPSLFRWLREVARATVSTPSPEAISTAFQGPLEHLAQYEAMPGFIRDCAARGLERIARNEWSPRFQLMHGDLWKGNILIDHTGVTDRQGRPWSERFVVIDWPGSEVEGYAMYDLVRLADSVSLGDKALRHEVEETCQALECSRADAPFHLAAALGFVGLNLEHFPEEIYRRMATECMERLVRVAGD